MANSTPLSIAIHTSSGAALGNLRRSNHYSITRRDQYKPHKREEVLVQYNIMKIYVYLCSFSFIINFGKFQLYFHRGFVGGVSKRRVIGDRDGLVIFYIGDMLTNSIRWRISILLTARLSKTLGQCTMI